MNLTVDRVSKTYKDKKAVDHFSADLQEGVYALLGPNGSGKSTLMRMMASILRPTSGRILLDGRDIATLDDAYRDVLGYMPQEFGVYKNFTAERFLRYFASLKGLGKKEAEEKIDELLTLVNLQGDRKRKAGRFSGGMKRRLGIAQALLNDPKVLIVDEPTAGLDPKERIRFRNLLSDISQDRIVLLSTHIVSDIESVAKEVLLMKEGALVRQSPVEVLLEEMTGKVWRTVVDEKEAKVIQARYQVSNIMRTAAGNTLRIISEEKPHVRAGNTEPTLEDVYVHFFDEEADDGV
ncbi:ABC transporter ATP-binding protein [Alteribacter keqinensis]|uniref:ABC transporter ATP-binding protein n=1 Tax=Alteribacter keqinensis TaxID=2483800 RepID=A0A3M7TQZ8_9BACI|nr:ABC transporter ATP-binding protein [Alteribacter keqinensis]RNA67119.1 ABC transporter ATP-binding protein [Alteribacter keqinensis]